MLNKLLLIFSLLMPATIQATPHFDNNTLPTENVKHFLEQCSGITIKDAISYSMAYGFCMGFVRGLVDGHDVTTRLLKHKLQDMKTSTVLLARIKPLWCMPRRITGGDNINAILTWINSNDMVYSDTMKAFGGADAVIAVTMRALTSTYHCKGE